MRIRRLKLHNYCQHRDREWLFLGSTIGIIGRNGSGKTNLTRAIRDAITPRFVKPKDKTLSHGAKSGYIELDFDVEGGDRLRVCRSLEKNRASLSLIDEGGGVVDIVADTITGTNEALARYIQVDPGVLQHIVFAGQEEITGLLFGKTAAKERLAQSFFGVERAKQVEKALGEVVSSLPSYNDSIPAMLSDCEAEIRVLTERRAALLATEVEGVVPQNLLGELRSIVTDYAVKVEESRRAVELERKIEGVEARLQEVGSRLNSEVALIEGYDLDKAQARLDAARRDAEVNKRFDLLNRQVELWQKTADRGSEVTALKQELDQVVGERLEIEASVTRAQSAIDAGEGVLEKLQKGEWAACPVCKHDVDPRDADSYRERLELDKENYASASKRRGELAAREEEVRGVINKVTLDVSMAEDRILEARTELTSIGQRRLAEPIQPLEDAISLIRESQDEINKLSSTIREGEGELRQLKEVLAELTSPSRGGGRSEVTEEDCAIATQRLQGHEAALAEISRIEGEHSEISGQIKTLEAQRSRLEGEHSRQQKAQRRRDLIGRVRSVFHYSRAPQTVISSRLLSIESRINYCLELLSVPFRVSVRNGLDFVCNFPDKDIDSSELSGGEKVDLSIAFRLAACETFGSNAGFVVLDEPTTWLDEGTKLEMIRVIERLNEIGEASGFQFFIPTHERMLLEHFDQVIEL